jgi:hypothetical protein
MLNKNIVPNQFFTKNTTFMKLSLYIFLFCCSFSVAFAQKKIANPAAEGFNESGSDAKAMAIADEVMQAMGGRKAWDKTRYLSWKFFTFYNRQIQKYKKNNSTIKHKKKLELNLMRV